MPKLIGKGAVTLAFDDAYLATFRHAIKYLDKHNIKSTLAVPVDLIGKRLENRPLVGIKELKRLIKSGHEIASHTLTHPNLLRLAAIDMSAAFSEITESKRKLECLLDYKVKSFVFPYIKNNTSEPLCSKAKSSYKSIRTTSDKSCFMKFPLKNSRSVTGFAVMKKHSLSCLNKLVDCAAENNLWLIEVFHLVSDKNTLSAHRPKPYRYFMHIDDFKKHVDHILSKDIPILTLKDGYGI